MIGVIADDLTGAAEIGAVGLRHGLSAEILTSGGKPSGGMDLICVDTDSRGCTPEEAARRVAAAANLLRAGGAEWVYKKVDSVLRGHVTAEVEAAMKQLQFNLALLVPANPSLGRTIREGRYFVKGKPIHKTEFARDPEHPRTSSLVPDLLDKARAFLISVCAVDAALPEAGIVVGEAGSSADVTHWAERIDSKKILAAGGAEFFGARLNATGHEKSFLGEASVKFNDDGRELFVCGTTSESGRAFLRAERGRRTPTFSLPVELAWGVEFLPAAVESIARRMIAAYESHHRIILNVGLTLARDRAVSRKLAEHLVRLAERVLRDVSVDRIYAEGGATSAELVRRMGWSRLTVSRELAPGVVALAVAGGQSRFLIIKPGSYVWPETIWRGATSKKVPVGSELAVS